jgi:hypothetical protein
MLHFGPPLFHQKKTLTYAHHAALWSTSYDAHEYVGTHKLRIVGLLVILKCFTVLL